MKKNMIFSFAAMMVVICMLLSGCNTVFGYKHEDNIKRYGKWETYLDVPSYLPASVSDYQVNGYSYTLYAYLDICFEIFLDITVTQEQFDQLVNEAKEYSNFVCEQEAYYCDGYTEIVYKDSYEIFRNEDATTENVGRAHIEKIIYNPETLNIIFVCFHTMDGDVYKLDDLAYFKRFSIKENEYVANLKK